MGRGIKQQEVSFTHEYITQYGWMETVLPMLEEYGLIYYTQMFCQHLENDHLILFNNNKRNQTL